MVLNLGDVAAGSTLYVPFATYNSSGASVTITGLATSDILIYKNGSVTQRASTAGYALLDTDGIDFDGIIGIHGFSVDLSDNTDAGFYAAGSVYWLVVSAITVDSQTVNFGYYFTIDKANVLRPTTAGRTLDVASTGEAGLDIANMNIPVGAIPLFGIADNGVAQAAAGTAATIRAAASFAADDLIGMTYFSAANSRIISDNDAADGVTLASAFTTNPGAVQYYIYGSPPGSNFEASLTDGAITAAKIATDAFTAAKFAADVGTEFAAAVGTRQIPDSYAADGAQPTIDQAILATLQCLTEAVVSGATILIKKPDGTTNAMTITCSPSVAGATSRTRSA